MLNKIVADVQKDIAKRKQKVPIDDLPSRSSEIRRLSKAISSCQFIPIIAEIKPKSPSEGIPRKNLNVAALAKKYEGGGAVGISVLTEPKYFGGSIENLVAVKKAVSSPVLRKDFILDEYQIHESFAYGADSLLLIVSCVHDNLAEFLSVADDLGVEAIVECRSKPEVELAVEAGAKIIGINNREIQTLQVDLNTTKQLARYVPNDRILVSESGAKTAADVRFLLDAGADAVLIGTALMKAFDPAEALQKFTRVI